MFSGLEIAGLTALGTLLATESAHLLWSRRTTLRPPRVPAGPAGVQAAHRGPGLDATAVPGWSVTPETPAITAANDAKLGSQPAPSAEPISDRTSEPISDRAPRRAVRALIYVNAPEQVREFLAHMTGEGYARPPVPRDPRQGSYSHEVWWGEYLRWAEARCLVTLTEGTFKANIKTHPCIAVSRDRVKDRHGRVVRTPGGSPLRTTNYTLHELAPVEAVTTDPVTGRRRKILVPPHEVKGVQRQLKRAA